VLAVLLIDHKRSASVIDSRSSQGEEDSERTVVLDGAKPVQRSRYR